MARWVLAAALIALVPAAANAAAADQQLDFGVKMAKRGLWREALFRFQQAHRLEPSDSKILNNVAVAHEAVGEFDEALEVYQEALRLAPSNRELRRNYSRFVEFYQAFRPPEEDEDEAAEEAAADGEAPAADVAAPQGELLAPSLLSGSTS